LGKFETNEAEFTTPNGPVAGSIRSQECPYDF